MSASAVAAPVGIEPRRTRETQHYGSIVVVGGGCYGSYYVRQLARARAAGAITFDRVLVVDREPDCLVAKTPPLPQMDVVVRDWTEFFSAYFADAALREPGRDAIVPSPLMPHLMYEWLVERARARWPTRHVATEPLSGVPPMPWQKAAPGGTHYVSFAEWMCPVNCIEPEICPAIKGPRTWTMPAAVRAFADAERARGAPLLGPVIFHCSHRAYGVGMFDTRDVLAADAFVQQTALAAAARVLVGTVSHCHGALSVLSVGPVPADQ